MTESSKTIDILETKIVKYFAQEFANYIGWDEVYHSIDTAMEDFKNSDRLDNIKIPFYVKDFFEPEFGISVKELCAILKENKSTFRDYICNILEKYKPETAKIVADNGIDFEESLKEGLLSDIFNKVNGSMNSSNDTDSAEVKKEIIKGSLENENINLDNLSDEELDNLLVKTVSVNEKVKVIINHLSEKTDEEIAECIHKYTGMHVKESLEIIKEFR